MPEILRETVEKDLAIMADPSVSTQERFRARVDLAISRRLISKGVEVLEDEPGAAID
jgi:hypothetical protein